MSNFEHSAPLDSVHHDVPDRHVFGDALQFPGVPKPNSAIGFPGTSPAPARADHVHPTEVMAGAMMVDFAEQPIHTLNFSVPFNKDEWVVLLQAPHEIEQWKNDSNEIVVACAKQEEYRIGWIAVRIAPHQEEAVM